MIRPLKPVLLFGSGRTGSTLAMSILSTSKDMVFRKDYPFETRLLTYAAHMADLTVQNSTGIEGWSHSSLNHSELEMMGPIPYPLKGYIDPEKFKRSVFDSLWRALSAEMRQAENRPDATFYAEKAPNYLADKLSQFTDMSCIQLVRDPRDILLSTKSFNAKRGTRKFGWQEDDTDESYAFRLIRRTRRRLTDLQTERKNGSSLIVKYEDLVTDQASTIKAMSEWVGTEFTAPPQDPDYLAKHSTSKNVGTSVARWKTQMDPKVTEMFSKEIPDLLNAFGYEA